MHLQIRRVRSPVQYLEVKWVFLESVLFHSQIILKADSITHLDDENMNLISNTMYVPSAKQAPVLLSLLSS